MPLDSLVFLASGQGKTDARTKNIFGFCAQPNWLSSSGAEPTLTTGQHLTLLF